jgi:hypothetical protein
MKYYHHQAINGTMTPEDEELLEEKIEELSCRWCGNGKCVETVPCT